MQNDGPLQLEAFSNDENLPNVISSILCDPLLIVYKDKESKTALHYACAGGALTTCKILIKLGIGSVLCDDINGCNVLHAACQCGSTTLAKIIMCSISQPLFNTNKCGYYPIHYIVQHKRTQQDDIRSTLRMMQNMGQHIDEPTKDGLKETPLHRACMAKCQEAVDALMYLGAKEIMDARGRFARSYVRNQSSIHMFTPSVRRKHTVSNPKPPKKPVASKSRAHSKQPIDADFDKAVRNLKTPQHNASEVLLGSCAGIRVSTSSSTSNRNSGKFRRWASTPVNTVNMQTPRETYDYSTNFRFNLVIVESRPLAYAALCDQFQLVDCVSIQPFTPHTKTFQHACLHGCAPGNCSAHNTNENDEDVVSSSNSSMYSPEGPPKRFIVVCVTTNGVCLNARWVMAYMTAYERLNFKSQMQECVYSRGGELSPGTCVSFKITTASSSAEKRVFACVTHDIQLRPFDGRQRCYDPFRMLLLTLQSYRNRHTRRRFVVYMPVIGCTHDNDSTEHSDKRTQDVRDVALCAYQMGITFRMLTIYDTLHDPRNNLPDMHNCAARDVSALTAALVQQTKRLIENTPYNGHNLELRLGAGLYHTRRYATRSDVIQIVHLTHKRCEHDENNSQCDQCDECGKNGLYNSAVSAIAHMLHGPYSLLSDENKQMLKRTIMQDNPRLL